MAALEPLSDAPLTREEAVVAGRNMVKDMRRCRCLWADVHCPNEATQEDGLCDWCGTRRVEDIAHHPNLLVAPDGEILGLGGAGQAHVDPSRTPDACWMPGSGKVLI